MQGLYTLHRVGRDPFLETPEDIIFRGAHRDQRNF